MQNMYLLIQLMLRASSNKSNFERKPISKETRAYEAKLQAELNQDRVGNGKKPFSLEKFEKEEMKEIKESTTLALKVGIT